MSDAERILHLTQRLERLESIEAIRALRCRPTDQRCQHDYRQGSQHVAPSVGNCIGTA